MNKETKNMEKLIFSSVCFMTNGLEKADQALEINSHIINTVREVRNCINDSLMCAVWNIT